MPLALKQFFYSISLTLKSCLITFLPLIIFLFMFISMVRLGAKAFSFVVFLLPSICISNFTATTLAYALGSFIFSKGIQWFQPASFQTTASLHSLWNCQWPKLLTNDSALMAGAFLGILSVCFFEKLAKKIANASEKVLMGFLTKLLVPLLPLFIFGFILKLAHDQVLGVLCVRYFKLFFLIAFFSSSYVFFLYLCFNRFSLGRTVDCIKAMSSAVFTGFSTLSSAAAVPLTLIAVQKNTRNNALSNAIVPATVNVHLIGDCFAIPLIALGILLSFGSNLPTLAAYLPFSLYFVLAKFSVAAVPGGGILVMLPILEKYLGFSSEMLSLATALYMLFDPIITAINIFGNGAFALGFSAIFKKKLIAVAST